MAVNAGTRSVRWAGIVCLVAAGAPAVSSAQSVFLFPIDTIEARLADDFEVLSMQESRGIEDERTMHAVVSFEDGTVMLAKWAPAPRGGDAFNNRPRYETAAYELQKLFLEPDEYVVPPTLIRAFPIEWARELQDDLRPTFRDTRSVIVALQYWLVNVTAEDFWDRDRFEADSTYARHFGNFNIFTYLIRHKDSNEGNFLISRSREDPRVFAVDNGLALESAESDRGTYWRWLRVDRLPAGTIDRLRTLAREDLDRRLETLAQFRVEPTGLLTPEPVGPAIDPDRGVRQADGVIQFGLTRREIRGIWGRIEDLLEDVDDGDIEVF